MEIAAAPSGAAEPRDYQVKPGDTLFEIAKRELGDGSRYEEIKKLNGLTSDLINVGDILKLPAK